MGIIAAHANRKLTIRESAQRLGTSVSGFKKLAARYRRLGLPGLTHGLRGKPPNKSPHPHRGKILGLKDGKYGDFSISQCVRAAGGAGCHGDMARPLFVAYTPPNSPLKILSKGG